MDNIHLGKLDIEKFIKGLGKLSDKEIPSYWIRGELKEAELYKNLAIRDKKVGA